MEALAGLSIAAVAIVAVIVVALVVVFSISRRYKIAGPDTAILVTGRKALAPVSNPESGQLTRELSGQKVVIGGGVFVKPLVESAHQISLASRSIPITIKAAPSKLGIRLNIGAVAIVKVGGTESDVRLAAQRFLGQQNKIDEFTQEVLAGSLRAVIGTLTVEEIVNDREAFATQVREAATDSLNNQGLVLDTLQVQDVSDDGQYLTNIGRPQEAEAARVAEVAEAENRKRASVAAAETEREIAEANLTLALRRSEIQIETDQASARANASGERARAEERQAVLAEEEKVAVRQASLTERRLDSDVRKPADARRYEAEQAAGSEAFRVEAEARASRSAAIAEAEARAESVRLAANADAEARRASGEAEAANRASLATAVEAEGRAKAAALEAVGSAEASALRERAEAYAAFGEAAQLDQALRVLPEVARAVSEPLSAVGSITILDQNGEGASRLSKAAGANISEVMAVVKATTGFDLAAVLAGLAEASEAPAPATTGPVRVGTTRPDGTELTFPVDAPGTPTE